MYKFIGFIIFVLMAMMVMAGSSYAVGPWVMEFYSFDAVMDTGTHAEGIAKDWLKEIYGKAEPEFSKFGRIPGPEVVVQYKGKDMKWFVASIGKTADDRNLSNGIYGGAGGDMSNYVYYGIVVVTSPNEQKTVMNVAQDDQLKVWNNGELVATDTSWTGGAETTRPHDVTLAKGMNVMLFKVSEEGGGDYLNVRFDAENLTFNAKVTNVLGLSVSPEGSLAKTWGAIKSLR